MPQRADHIWRDPERAKQYLENNAGRVPFENDQFDIMLRLISYGREGVKRFLDIGCGDGVLSAMILAEHPEAQGALLDFSDTMLAAAQSRLHDLQGRTVFIKADYGDSGWISLLPANARIFDVIVTRFSVHHQPDDRKWALYEEVHSLLVPGGVFLNIEHVAPASLWAGQVFEDYMVDYLHVQQQRNGEGKERATITSEFRDRHANDADVITSAEVQCDCLRQIGFTDVDIYFKAFQIAIFGGRKDTNE